MDDRRVLGNEGETIAAQFLAHQGYDIIHRQWRGGGRGEIDIVAQKDREYVFVEVKTRTGDEFGYPEEAVTHAKRAQLVRLIETYLARYQIAESKYRCDVIAIEFDQNSPKVTHLIGVEL